jgi:hypothetical protein
MNTATWDGDAQQEITREIPDDVDKKNKQVFTISAKRRALSLNRFRNTDKAMKTSFGESAGTGQGAEMKPEEHRDSDANMRAIFYQQMAKKMANNGQKKKGKKTDCHAPYVEKAKKNVRLHQKPLTKTDKARVEGLAQGTP